MLLRKPLHNGFVIYSENENALWKSDPIFMAHKLDNVCLKVDKQKEEGDRNDDVSSFSIH